MLHILKTTALSTSLLISAMSANAAAIATVNGKEISQEMYQAYAQQIKARQKDSNIKLDKKRLVDELVNRELLHQAALEMKLDKNKEIQFLMEQQKIDLLTKAAMKEIVDKSPVTEGEIEETYKKIRDNSNPMEFKARHILLKTEDDAKSIIKKLNKGADFATLAKEKSTGPSAKSGGDLGWFKPAQMVPEFSKAVMDMKKGEFSKQAVKTQFGYHIIKLEDSRKIEPPKLADVKDKIRGLLQQQRIQQYITEKRKTAKVEVK